MYKTGVVKWFNKKKGYGFITEVTGETLGDEYFVHHSGVVRENDGYKFLVEGEYVTYEEGKSEDDRIVCVNVRGIGRGSLLCERERTKRPVSE